MVRIRHLTVSRFLFFQKGQIDFRDVVLRYRDDLPTVLKGLTASIQAGERIGVVGRTGTMQQTIGEARLSLLRRAPFLFPSA